MCPGGGSANYYSPLKRSVRKTAEPRSPPRRRIGSNTEGFLLRGGGDSDAHCPNDPKPSGDHSLFPGAFGPQPAPGALHGLPTCRGLPRRPPPPHRAGGAEGRAGAEGGASLPGPPRAPAPPPPREPRRISGALSGRQRRRLRAAGPERVPYRRRAPGAGTASLPWALFALRGAAVCSSLSPGPAGWRRAAGAQVRESAAYRVSHPWLRDTAALRAARQPLPLRGDGERPLLAAGGVLAPEPGEGAGGQS